MSLTEQLQADMKNAMRDGDAHRRDTLRMAIAAVQNAAKDKRDDLTDEEALAVLTKQVHDAVAALPSFDLFPWFFVIPGALVAILAVVAMRSRRPAADDVAPSPNIPAMAGKESS